MTDPKIIIIGSGHIDIPHHIERLMAQGHEIIHVESKDDLPKDIQAELPHHEINPIQIEAPIDFTLEMPHVIHRDFTLPKQSKRQAAKNRRRGARHY